MKGFCGIDLEKDKLFISFASFNKGRLNFLEEVKIDVSSEEYDFLEFFRKNITFINQKIIERKNIYSLDIFDIFINIDLDMVSEKVIEENVPFNKLKKISISDINFAKKYLENSSLEWNDLCIHNFVINYNINNQNYDSPPLGILTKKINLKSLLISVKNNLYDEVNSIFDAFNLKFLNFVYKPVSAFSIILKRDFKDRAVFYIGYDKSYLVIYLDKKITAIKSFNFGLKSIFFEIEKKFLIPIALSKEIFNRYISFREDLPFKEITIKNNNSYMNLNINTLNLFIKNHIKDEISKILENFSNLEKKDIEFAFLGRLNLCDGFSEFVKNFVSYPTEVIKDYGLSCSFGAIKYGIERSLENNFISKPSILKKIVEVYKEYF